MSERGYFQLRWAVPGFSFILVVIGFNYIPLLEIIRLSQNSELLGVVLGLLSLFTASAIGFLATQSYWWRYNRKCEFLSVFKREKLETILAEYGFNSQEKDEERKKVIFAILDFTVYLGAGDKLLGYIWRRWDIFHLQRTTRVALLTGVAAGVIMRIYYAVFSSMCSYGLLKEYRALLRIACNLGRQNSWES